MRRGLVWLLAGAVLLAGMLGGFTWREYRQFLDQPLAIPPDGQVIRIEPGDTPAGTLVKLEAMGVTRADWRWRLLLRQEPVTIRTREYRLQTGLRPLELLRHLASFDVVQHRFTIVEGWTYRQLVAALQEQSGLAVDAGRLAPDRVMAAIGSEESHPEGWFLPETYAWVRGEDAIDLLQRAHGAMREALAGAWAGRAEDLPLEDPYELLVLASIVEKESGLSAERSAIAGVFTRRLQQRWRLETDPTVIYGLGPAFDGDIRTRDLRTDNPYNTYTRHGLPPTPIAMPGRDALGATAQPADGSAMFFVADGAGGHVFSDTLAEHNRAVDAYLRGQGQRP